MLTNKRIFFCFLHLSAFINPHIACILFLRVWFHGILQRPSGCTSIRLEWVLPQMEIVVRYPPHRFLAFPCTSVSLCCISIWGGYKLQPTHTCEFLFLSNKSSLFYSSLDCACSTSYLFCDCFITQSLIEILDNFFLMLHFDSHFEFSISQSVLS